MYRIWSADKSVQNIVNLLPQSRHLDVTSLWKSHIVLTSFSRNSTELLEYHSKSKVISKLSDNCYLSNVTVEMRVTIIHTMSFAKTCERKKDLLFRKFLFFEIFIGKYWSINNIDRYWRILKTDSCWIGVKKIICLLLIFHKSGKII